MDKILKTVPNSLKVMGEGERKFRERLWGEYGVVIGNDPELLKFFEELREELIGRGLEYV